MVFTKNRDNERYLKFMIVIWFLYLSLNIYGLWNKISSSNFNANDVIEVCYFCIVRVIMPLVMLNVLNKTNELITIFNWLQETLNIVENGKDFRHLQ